MKELLLIILFSAALVMAVITTASYLDRATISDVYCRREVSTSIRPDAHTMECLICVYRSHLMTSCERIGLPGEKLMGDSE